MKDEVRRYLAEIGRRGGKQPKKRKVYASNADRQKAYRDRKRKAPDEPTVDRNQDWGA